ncbi:MAG: efflux RND transporter periplasmic adaptor subunit [Caulobacteraceae bacterium]
MNINTEVGSKLKFKISKKRIVIIAAALLLIAAIVIVGFNYTKSKNAKSTVRQQTVMVRRGDLSVTVTGSGPISSTTKYDLTSNVSGTLTKVNFKDGDKVKAGDLIFEIDDKDTQLQIKQLKSSIAQQQLTQNSNIKDLHSGTVVAAIDGEVSNIQAKEGDTLSNNGTLMTITDKSKIKLVASFNDTYRTKLSIGQTVTVNAYDTTTEELNVAKGSISSISTPSYKTSNGTEVYNVGVTIENSSELKEGMVANVSINVGGNEIKSTGSSTLSYVKSMTVKATSGGTVSKLNVENGQNVKKGDVLAVLDNDDLKTTIESNELKLNDLYSELQTAEEKLKDYQIYAPFDGTFTLSDIKQGNSIKQGDTLGSVANYDIMEFDINVDELDIAKIKEGQTASVTIDALTDTTEKPLKGTVSKIAVEGTSSDGVTTYPVAIQIEENTALKGGMNANAEIEVSKKTDVLYVPVDAVQKRNGKSFVSVVSGAAKTGGNTNQSQRNQQNSEFKTERKEVTTGISTEEYIEIVSGLNEGEAVVVTSTSNTGNTRQNMPGGMGIPMGGGGLPGGGGGNSQKRN